MTFDERAGGSMPTPMGHGRMLRKEDARFIRGRGRYVDDIALPGMLHGAVLRSPTRTPGSSPWTPAPPSPTRWCGP